MSVSVQSKPLSASSALSSSRAATSKASATPTSNGHPIADAPVSDASVSDKVCWVELQRYPYHPDHQVELLHLQAEADALIIKLQSVGRKSALED